MTNALAIVTFQPSVLVTKFNEIYQLSRFMQCNEGAAIGFGTGLAQAWLGGAALGAMFNPFLAAFVGAFAGVIVGAAAEALVCHFTAQIFDLNVVISVKNVYGFLYLDHHAISQEIDVAYEARMIRNNNEPNQQEQRRLGIMFNINVSIIQNDQRNRVENTLRLPIMQN